MQHRSRQYLCQRFRRLASYSLAVFLASLLAACGPTLKRSEPTSAIVEKERSEQMRLARELAQKRKLKLNEIAMRLAPHARTLCKEALGKKPTDCTYKYEVVESDARNASADGTTVRIHTGLMRFVESDDELAVIVGHEMAHNMLGHIDKKRGGAIVGAIIDGFIAGSTGIDTQGAFSKAGALAYSQEYESEADYLGVYIAHRAGYDITVAPDLWRRMGAESPESIGEGFAATHPSTPERSASLSEAIYEIGVKEIEGYALVPARLDDGSSDTLLETQRAIVGVETPSSGEGAVSSERALTSPAALEAVRRATAEREAAVRPMSEAQRMRDSFGIQRAPYAPYQPPSKPKIGESSGIVEEMAVAEGCSLDGIAELIDSKYSEEIYKVSCTNAATMLFQCAYRQCEQLR